MNAATASAVRAPTPGMARSRATAGVWPRLAVQLLLDALDLPGERLDLPEEQVTPGPLRGRRRSQLAEPRQPLLRPQAGPLRGGDAGAARQRPGAALGPRPPGD